MDHPLGETLIIIGGVIMACALILALAGCTNVDVNGYRARGGSTGAVTCHGACP